MGFFSKIKRGFKKVVSFAGNIVKPVVAGLATVVNPVLGGVVGGVFGATSKTTSGSAPYHNQPPMSFAKTDISNPYGTNPLASSPPVQPAPSILGGIDPKILMIAGGALLLIVVIKK